jgi:hypothetical protein
VAGQEATVVFVKSLPRHSSKVSEKDKTWMKIIGARIESRTWYLSSTRHISTLARAVSKRNARSQGKLVPAQLWSLYISNTVNGSLSTRNGASSVFGWRRQPPDMEGSCEYIEKTVADSRQGVVLQIGGRALKKELVTKCYTGPRACMDSLERLDDMDWIDLTWVTDQWLMNTVMKLRVP